MWIFLNPCSTVELGSLVGLVRIGRDPGSRRSSNHFPAGEVVASMCRRISSRTRRRYGYHGTTALTSPGRMRCRGSSINRFLLADVAAELLPWVWGRQAVSRDGVSRCDHGRPCPSPRRLPGWHDDSACLNRAGSGNGDRDDTHPPMPTLTMGISICIRPGLVGRAMGSACNQSEVTAIQRSRRPLAAPESMDWTARSSS